MMSVEDESSFLNTDSDKRKQRLIELLTIQINQIRKEMERTLSMRGRTRIMYEFERPPFFHHVGVRRTDFWTERPSRRGASEVERIDIATEYASDAGLLLLTDVLKQSKKLVFLQEWEIGYREHEVVNILSKIEKERKRRKLVRVSKSNTWIDVVELKIVRNRIFREEREKRKILALIGKEVLSLSWNMQIHGGNREDKCSSIFGLFCKKENVVPCIRDFMPDISVKRVEVFRDQGAIKPHNSRHGMLKAFNRYLGIFSKCVMARSCRGNFQQSPPLMGIHSTNNYIFKRISADYMQCKSAREIIGYKYKNVVLDKRDTAVPFMCFPNVTHSNSFWCPYSSSGSEDEPDFNLFLNLDKMHSNEETGLSLERTNLETPFDRFLNGKSRTENGSSEKMKTFPRCVETKFMDFSKNKANAKVINDRNEQDFGDQGSSKQFYWAFHGDKNYNSNTKDHDLRREKTEKNQGFDT